MLNITGTIRRMWPWIFMTKTINTKRFLETYFSSEQLDRSNIIKATPLRLRVLTI